MRPPRNVSPAAARRRALLVDVVLGLLLACLAILVTAGIGVVGFLALLGALALGAWFLVEGGLRSLRRRRVVRSPRWRSWSSRTRPASPTSSSAGCARRDTR